MKEGARHGVEQPGAEADASYPVQLSVEYPDRSLNRLTTAFSFIAIPILIVAASIGGPAAGRRRSEHVGRPAAPARCCSSRRCS